MRSMEFVATDETGIAAEAAGTRVRRPGRAHRVALVATAFAILAQACAAPDRLPAVPEDRQGDVVVEGMEGVRYWRQKDLALLQQDGIESFYKESELWKEQGNAGPLPPAHYLAISGGGEDGAYGAGLLLGWTETGERPEFKLVTGISTGALTAPFAFLGPAYDEALKDVYTNITADDVLVQRYITAAIFDDGLADTAPLRALVARHVDQEMLDAIAAEHERGRILLIGTTNIDARRPVIWNITKIAASGHPDALNLVRQILVASAAIPGVFPPVMIDVALDGVPHQEMHVDGGASAQVFVYPPQLRVADLQREQHITRERRLWLIRNGRLDPDWAETKRVTMDIAGRAVSSLIQNQGVGDLFRIHEITERDGVDFNLAYIPPTFDVPLEEPFDQTYMRALFDLGYQQAVEGYPWRKGPPNL
jgi:predicted acylesterase/phospholipase RssA